jgi:hypothetical protein
MIDVNQITSTLRSMPDQQLQQYAAMHKGDPYILSLAVSESNQRKKMRAAAQGQAGGQMPKVADAAIAGMAQQQLPEDQGIAQIPAPNMQRMADGGIAGYGDDANEDPGMAMGGMFDFAQRSEPVIRMAGGGHIPRYQGMPKAMGGDGSLVGDIPGFQAVSPRAQFTQAGAPENQTLWEQISNSLQGEGLQRKIQIIEDRIARGIAGPEEKAYYEQLKAKAAGTPQLAAPKDTFNPDEALLASEKAGKAKATADKAPATKDASAASRTQGTQGTQGGTSGQGIQNMYELFAGPKNKRDTELNEIERRIREQGEAETSFAQQQLNRLKADIAAQGEYGKDKEAKLKAKEERIGKEEGKAGGLALLEAGLAMMSGTSSNAFANIGQGAMVGTAAYRKSLDKIEDAKDKLDDAYGRLEDVRFNQKNLNNAEIRKATADVEKAANAGLKSLTDFAVTRYGMSREDAKTMFTGAMQERVANIGAGATITAAQMRSKDNDKYLETIKGSGAIEQARKNVMEQVIKANKYGTPEQIQTQFEKEWEKTLQLNPALAKLAGTSGGGSAPAGGADFVLNPQTGKLEPRK